MNRLLRQNHGFQLYFRRENTFDKKRKGEAETLPLFTVY